MSKERNLAKTKTVFLIDATALCYRAFFALRGLSTSYGQPTNAIYGFVNMLNKLIKDYSPRYLAACFDVSRDTFRQRKFAEYKITRAPMPDGLSDQIGFIKDIIQAYGLKIFEKEGFEADDILATLTQRMKKYALSVTIVSADKDILQLIDKDVRVLNPYKEEGKVYFEKDILERYRVMPQRISDILALMGDSVDNIPGVPGIGEKTAIELIRDYDSLDNLIKNIDKIKSQNLKKAIRDNLDKIALSRELVQLDRQVDLKFELEDLKLCDPDYKKLYEIFKRLEFNRFLKGLPHEQQDKIRVKKCLELKDPADFIKGSKNKRIFLAAEYETKTLFVSQAPQEVCYRAGFDRLTPLLSDPAIIKTGYDLKKLILFLDKSRIKFSGIHFDIMIAAYLLDPSRRDYRLESIAENHLGVVLDASDGLTALDLILQLAPVLDKEIKDKSLHDLFYRIEMPLIEVLAGMQRQGIMVDVNRLNSLSQDLECRLSKLIEEIHSLSGQQFNINSPKQLRQVLFDKLKLPIVKKTKSGPSTDEQVLKKLTKHHPLPQLLLEYRQLTKLKSTYIDSLPQLINPQSGRIHASFSQVATETGRLACSQPNLQNIPVKTQIGKKIRQAFIAKDDQTLLLSLDYSQIELRLLAHFSKDEALTQAFLQGKDIHKATAALIYGKKESEVTEQMRELAKRINFSIVYGLSAYSLASDLEISFEEAQGFIDSYFSRYPKVEKFISSQIDKARRQGFVTTILGRRRYIPEINNKNAAIRGFAERQAVNTPIQGSAADLIKLAMIDIFKAVKEQRLKIKMVLQIHDELLFEVDRGDLRQEISLVKEKMENVYRLDVPVKVDIAVGNNWLEMKGLE